MNTLHYTILLSFFFTLVFSAVITPLIRHIGYHINLIDKPNHRKQHTLPIPLVGGIVIFISSIPAAAMMLDFHTLDIAIWKIIVASSILLIVGVIDDKMEVRALYKLLIQVFCAAILVQADIRLTSLYGVLGIHDLPVTMQYIVSIILIVGIVNANNLMDGIDGLAGSMCLIGFGLLGVISIVLDQHHLAIICSVIGGALIGFLYYNTSHKHKIFMGDAGTLSLGILQIGFALYLLNIDHNLPSTQQVSWVLPACISIFFIPVVDSLRVYLFRIKKGLSPFTPDRTHIHHLFLGIEMRHIKVTIAITGLSLFITFISIILQEYLGLISILIVSFLILRMVYFILNLNLTVTSWQNKVKILEDK